MQSFSCQHREQHISKRNYEITLVQEIHISRLQLQRWPLEFVIPFLKVPKREIFDRSDFPDFYIIKSLCVGDFGVKTKFFFTNN
jgi:hypothetical protein